MTAAAGRWLLPGILHTRQRLIRHTARPWRALPSLRQWLRQIYLSAGLIFIGGAVIDYWRDNRSPWWANLVSFLITTAIAIAAPKLYDSATRRAEARERLEKEEKIRTAADASRARLLDPSRAVVDFTGRRQEIEDLINWCSHKEESASPVRLITGSAGVGKSRLAIQLCAKLEKRGWQCKWIGGSAVATALSTIRETYRHDLLLVVDYAETRVGLPELLREVATDAGTAARVLLLARSVGEWWDRLMAADPDIRELLRTAAEDEPLPAAMDGERTGTELVWDAVPRFAEALGVDPPKPEQVQLEIGDDRTHEILYLHATALVVALKAPATPFEVVQIKVSDALDELLKHEERYWYGTADTAGLLDGVHGMTSTALQRIVAACCLLGAETEAEAIALLERVPGATVSLKVATWLRDLYPPHTEPDMGATEWLGTLQPDPLEEHHAITQLTISKELAESCLSNLNGNQALRAISLLARATDHPKTESLLEYTMPLLTRSITELPANIDMLRKIAYAIPYRSEALAEASVAAIQRILEILPYSRSPDYARWLVSLGTALKRAGRPNRALPHVEDAVGIYRELVEAVDDTAGRDYRLELAASLSNLSNAYTELGHAGKALPMAEEAVRINRRLGDTHPGLATSLTNLGHAYFALDRTDDAIRETEESIEVYRRLTEIQPDQYRPELATSLTNLGQMFSELDRSDDALSRAKEAVEINRKLAETQPDRYRSGLATSLLGLGIVCSKRDPVEDALAATQEAEKIFRELWRTYPDRYRPDLKDSLTMLEWLYSRMGLESAAADACRRAQELKTVP